MSSFNFVRQKAGEYNITKNSQFVGKIKKLKTSKWIVADVEDTPQHVSKTLKDAKDACINLIIFDEVVDKVEESKYSTFVEVDKNDLGTSKVFNEPTLDPILF